MEETVRESKRIKRSLWIDVLLSGPCHYCGDPRPAEVDHLHPRSRGGTNSPANLVPACYSCNREKGAFTVEEWREARLRLGSFWPPAPITEQPVRITDNYLATQGMVDLSKEEQAEVRRLCIAVFAEQRGLMPASSGEEGVFSVSRGPRAPTE